jgi:predicted O-linked N-acetylglucosamine transferase (SPINDLY family)/glycosyltransferase involved in cell wall biosynthesis/SAM-dependent methyltransferase
MTISPPHIIKQRAIGEYQREYGYSLFIETGTYLGDMVDAQKHQFERIISIELGADLFERAKTRFAGDHNVTIMQGDSGKILPQILAEIKEPAIFWLDGHYSEGITAMGDKACPIFEELDAIFASTRFNHVILIDDARCFGAIDEFPTVEKLTEYIQAKNEGYQVEIENDIIRCVHSRNTGAPVFVENTDAETDSPQGRNSDWDKLKAGGLLPDGVPLRLHLGCGEKHFDGYVNIDCPPDQHNVMQVNADYFADITQLDFPPQSVDEIRLHHVFEHFNRVTALAMLIRWQMWLKVGGKLLIETPDLMGSAETLVSNASWNVKMGAVRHLAGDQAATWAYHTDHWFPSRFERTFKCLGFGTVETKTSRWPHEPHLCNVEAMGVKTEIYSLEKLLAAADGLLWESTVSPLEKPTCEVWTRQLRDVLAGGSCGPGGMPRVALPAKPQPAPAAEAQPGPDSNPDLIPLAEIHDFNQLARDRWVRGKAQSVPAGSRVLDVGAGTCLYRPLFAHCDYKTHDFAQYEGVKHGGGTGYGNIDYVSDILAIPVPDASFDVILCTEVLEHVPEPIKVLAEIARILRPGGRAFVTAPLGSHLHQLPFHFYGGYTPEWYKRFGAACGLNPIEITPNGGFFKHLAQECARAAYMYSQQTNLHGSDAAEIHKLLSDSMPRFFFELDDKCFDEKCTVGFQVEFIKGAHSSQTDGTRGARTKLAPVSVRPQSACPAVAHTEKNAMATGATVETGLDINRAASGPPVVVKLMGGLGNQMFQYAAGLALARKHGVPLKLDLCFLIDRTPRPNFTYRDFDLDLFSLAPDCELIREPHHLPQGLRSIPEKHFHFDSSVPESPAGIYLDGYWQSPRYFEPVLDEVRKTFSSFATPLSAENQKLAAEIATNNAVCLHVRRTDMVADPVTAAVHGSCGLLYVQEASALISKRHPDAHYFVFSDDIEWCRASGLLAGHPHTFIEHRTPGNDTGADFQLMMLCRHFIISNSTYGWWAAYLGAPENGTVIMPEPWFSDSSKETTDLVPKGWIRLSRQPGPLPATPANTPTVSVIIPCFNQSRFLPEALASVVAQTYSDWEAIIVNDGSPDDTSRVARELIELYPGRRIRLLEKTNGGLADARNAGIKEAVGRFILPLDSDDKIHPQMLEKTVAMLETQPGISIVYTDLMRFGEMSGIHCAAEYDFVKLCQQNQLNCCSLYRREIWEKVGGYNPNMRWGYEDWNFWIDCGKRGFVGQRLGEPLFFYRTKRESMFTVANSHGDELLAQIVRNHPALYTPEARSWAENMLLADKPSKPELQAVSEEKLLVSVIVPCYNQAGFLTAAVESVVAQTCSQWEIIIVNDGSTDETHEVAGQLRARFPAHRIRLVEKENGGLADARNAGIRFAKGKYILPLDADDLIAPTFLEKTVGLLEENPQIGIAYTDWVYFGTMEGRRNAMDWDARHLCENENLFTCTALFRKEAWDGAGGYNINMTKGVEDWDFWISCVEKGHVGRRIPEALFCYRAKSRSMITDVQPFVPVMFARIILNHPKLYGPELVAKAEIIFNSAGLPPPKPSFPGREWLPGQAIGGTAGRDIVPASAPAELIGGALPQTNQELSVRKMNAMVCSGENVAMLESYRARLESPPIPSGGEATELAEFPSDELDGIRGLVSSWKERPQDEALLAQLRQLRQSVASYLVGARDADAGALLSGSFGIVYRSLLESGLQDEGPTPEEEGVAEFLTGGFDEKGDFSFLRLLAFILFRRAHRSPPLYALEVLPKWFLRDYIGWVFSVPAVLVEKAEAETYAHHLTGWLREFLRRIPQNSVIGLPLSDITTLVLERLNLIPVYCSGESTRELMELRARLLENSLSAAGADLDGPKTRRALPAKGKRIRIGVLNAHFGLQTETFVTLPSFHLDRSKFEVFLFAGFANPGEVESRCRGLADHFTVLPSALPEQVRIIRDVKLDALIVGTNITAVTNGMCLLAAHRLAPVQILSHCSPMTSGLRNVDAFLSGSLAYRPGLSEAEFSEKLVLLDGPPVCLDYTTHPGSSPGSGDRAKLGLPPDEFLFLNAASCFKISVELMDAWAQILQQVPNSRLLLMPFNPNWANKFPQAQFERALTDCLQRYGVDKNRVILSVPFTSRAQVMDLEKMADLYLDTFPFSGSISTVDPLELGIPVVASDGQTTRSRCSGAQLREIGIPELVAQNAGEYIRIAVRLAQNAGLRSALSARIRLAMSKKPRFLDPDAFGRQLSRVMEGIVRRGWEALPAPPQADSQTAHPNPLPESVGEKSALPVPRKSGGTAEANRVPIPAVDLDAHTPMQVMRMARAAFETENWASVEDLCRHVLERAPETAAAWALLGELARRSGDLNHAAELIGQAMDLDSDNADFWCTLGEIRREKMDPDGALDAFRHALELRPAFPNAWLMIAIVHDERKESAQAEKAYGQALLQSKDRVETARIRINFASFLREQKRMKEAIKQMRKAVSAVPDSCETMLLLGSFFQEGGDPGAAMAAFSSITKKFPGNGKSWLEWGKTLLLLGKPGEAVEKMRKAVACQPDDPDALFNLGFALQRNIQRTESLQVYLDAERSGCDTGDLHTNIGVILKDQERYMEAAQRFHKGFERNPESHAAMNNLGAVCINMGLTTEAIECFQHALRLNPTMSAPHSNLGHMLKISGKASEGMDYYLKGLKLDPENKEIMHNYLLSTLYQVNLSPQEIFEEHRKGGVRLAAGIKSLPRRHVRDGHPQGKIRIGYVSPDLCLHPVSFFAAPLMGGHDRGRFEVYAYADVHKEDAVTARFRSAVDVWHDITEMKNSEVGELMQKDEVDILVDLCGHTAHNRLEVLAARPAPIIASYLGYPATTGMPGVDFRITDALADPLGQTDAWHTEKLVRLDRCAWCFEPPANTPPVGPLPWDVNGFLTFGCFNNLAKLNAPLYDAWVKILKQIPNSRLFLKAKTLIDPGICQEVRDYFTARGISVDRLRVSGFEASSTCHLDRYNEVDIALDSYPYHGTTTTCEALWMGVPVVTRTGEAHLSRVGASLLHAVSHPELVAPSEEEYIRLAVELARDPARLRALRAGLRGQMQSSSLLDQVGFIRALEEAFLSLLSRPSNLPAR